MYLIISIYSACIFFNVLYYRYLEKKLRDNPKYVFIFTLFVLSGPILSIYSVYKNIRGRLKRKKRKKEIAEAIKRELPDLLKKYKITVKEN